MRKRLNVLLTVGGGPGVWGAMDALRRWPGQPVTLIVNEPGGAATVGTGLADRAVALPDADQDGYRDALVELCRSARIDVVVPLYDGELRKVADVRRRLLECGTRVLLPPDETVRLGSDKFATHRALIGTAYIPDFRMVLSVEELQDAITALGYPREILCVRPHFGTGGRGIHLLDSHSADKVRQFRSKPGPWRGTADAFVEWYRVAGDDYPLLVTAFLPGVELGIDVLATDGRVDALVVRQKGGGGA